MLTGPASGDFHPICPSLFPGSPLLMSVSTLLAEHSLAGLERAFKERLGLSVAALGRVEFGEIVHAYKRVGMLLA